MSMTVILIICFIQFNFCLACFEAMTLHMLRSFFGDEVKCIDEIEQQLLASNSEDCVAPSRRDHQMPQKVHVTVER